MLKTSKRVIKDQKLLTDCLKGVRGDCMKNSISMKNIESLMEFHLRSQNFTPEMIQRMEDDPKTIHLFATNDSKDDFNRKKLQSENCTEKPVAVIKSTTAKRCREKSSNHWDNNRTPSSTVFCVGCKVALIGINIKPELVKVSYRAPE